MKTKCPHCGEEYEVEADALGQTAECATCGGEFQVRDAEAKPAGSPRKPSAKIVRAPAKKKRTPVATRCPFCQTQLPPGAVKCASCGEWLPGSKPKDPIPYIILLLLFGQFGLHNFYAKQPAQGIVKIVIVLMTLLFLCLSSRGKDEEVAIVITIVLALANAVWCIIDLCRYKEILSAAGKS